MSKLGIFVDKKYVYYNLIFIDFNGSYELFILQLYQNNIIHLSIDIYGRNNRSYNGNIIEYHDKKYTVHDYLDSAAIFNDRNMKSNDILLKSNTILLLSGTFDRYNRMKTINTILHLKKNANKYNKKIIGWIINNDEGRKLFLIKMLSIINNNNIIQVITGLINLFSSKIFILKKKSDSYFWNIINKLFPEKLYNIYHQNIESIIMNSPDKNKLLTIKKKIEPQLSCNAFIYILKELFYQELNNRIEELKIIFGTSTITDKILYHSYLYEWGFHEQIKMDYPFQFTKKYYLNSFLIIQLDDTLIMNNGIINCGHLLKYKNITQSINKKYLDIINLFFECKNITDDEILLLNLYCNNEHYNLENILHLLL